jgi:hypothetical protein
MNTYTAKFLTDTPTLIACWRPNVVTLYRCAVVWRTTAAGRDAETWWPNSGLTLVRWRQQTYTSTRLPCRFVYWRNSVYSLYDLLAYARHVTRLGQQGTCAIVYPSFILVFIYQSVECRVLLEKLVQQLAHSALFETCSVTEFTGVRHWSLSWGRRIHSTLSKTISLTFSLILSVRLSRLGGVTVSVFAIAPEVREFKPGRGDGFLRPIKPTARLPLDGK